MAAFLIVPPSVVQLSHAQPNQDMKDVLDLHNRERAAVKAPPLTWSDSLAAEAQSWANHLGTLGVICSPQGSSVVCNPSPPHGANNENMAFGAVFPADVGGNRKPVVLAEWWVSYEKPKFDAGQRGCCGIGHYTAMIWKSTRELGCGYLAGAVPDAQGNGGGTDFLVCRYLPGGNVASEAPQNLPATCLNDQRRLIAC